MNIFEKIKTMSEDELAKFLCDKSYENSEDNCDCCVFKNLCSRSKNGAKAWLLSEYK